MCHLAALLHIPDTQPKNPVNQFRWTTFKLQYTDSPTYALVMFVKAAGA